MLVVVGYWRFGAIPRAVPVVWNQYTFYSIGYTTTLVVASILKVKSGVAAGRAPWLVAVLAHSGGFQGVLRALYDYKTSLVDTGHKRTPIFPQKTKNTRLEPCRLTG